MNNIGPSSSDTDILLTAQRGPLNNNLVSISKPTI